MEMSGTMRDCQFHLVLIRYAGLAVGLKPSATECEARLRGLERSMYSKTITLGDR